MSGEYHVLQVLLAKYSRDRFIRNTRELLLGRSHARSAFHEADCLVQQHENDNDIGVAVIDSFTHHILQFMEGIDKTSQSSMQDLVSFRAHPQVSLVLNFINCVV